MINFNVSKFVKEHIPLCVGTLGLAILGYLGYHAIHWIISKCQKTEKIDQVAQRTLTINNYPISIINGFEAERKIIAADLLLPKPLINRVDDLISPDKITMGQGEYVVFHKLPSGEKQPLSPEIFERVYQVLLQRSPVALVNSESENAIEECANRYELLKAKLKEIDPTLEAVFVPRTLYELVFIRKCIQEDVKRKEVCQEIDYKTTIRFKKSLKDDEYQEFFKEQKKRKCWHLCHFTDMGDDEHVGVKDVAYRLNKVLFKTFNPSDEGFTHQELSAFAEKEIDFLKAYYKEHSKTGAYIANPCCSPGPAINFYAVGLWGDDSVGRCNTKPMGIRNEIVAQIIIDAVSLECSKIAQHSLFLYRGANFQEDSTFCSSDQNKPHSLSYGSSLFAGCLYQGEASAFYHMRNKQNAYAISVPFDQLNDSPFFIPTTHTVAQLFSLGETFHPRSKVWKGFDGEEIDGIDMVANSHMRDHLQSNLSKEELNLQFNAYKDSAFQLK